ncbi:MAG TPA: HAMP domain-containing histidine kinase [Candidatus Blautia stercoripullorum]|uniref:histidine kinase n=1 Tax=Candidatus Blautia stercoripullorum TaxID=2838502 RepID=A0A9D2R9G7_9FIRM|nr:HAMP domain-containing histidine kinase [Candidatus Blautia stercoripullorum]
MDWIDEQIMKIQDKVRNLSLLKGALVYLAFFSGIAMILTILTNRISDRRIFMWLSGSVEMAEWEPSFWTFLEHWAGYIYMGTGMVLMLVLFYHNRLKKPIRIIQEGVEEFRKQNLGFPLEYDSRDEMGELCRLLDSMRENLEERYEDLWQTIENQRKLNAAFAHDLRTPLTVLKGYSEFLARYLPQGKVNAEKMVQVLELMSGQLERLTSFCKTMKSARSLEEYPVEKRRSTLEGLCRKIRGILEALSFGGEVELSLACDFPAEKQGYYDENLVLEVLENLLSNAIRYAESSIVIELDTEKRGGKEYLYLYVEDDGPGFSGDGLREALEPYWGQENSGEHFGLGLHICKTLCQLHGGAFSIANQSRRQGAIASASFEI